MLIPKQLQNPEFRFCLIRKQTKAPFEKDWQNKSYYFNDPKLQSHIKRGGNYGVIGGYGNLRILDIDDKSKVEQFKKEYNNTFMVKTGSGGLHIYFISEYDTNHVLIDEVGELRAKNYQCVGAGSIHPNGNKYEVISNKEIIQLPKEMLGSVVKPYLRTEAISVHGEKDPTGSGLEFRRCLAMIREKKSRKIIYKEMQNYRKWATSGDDYKNTTYNKAMDIFLKEIEKKEEKKEDTPQEEFKFKEIYKKLVKILKYYCDLKEEYYSLIAVWIIGTYFHNSFTSYPYLYFNAMKSSGKSRLLSLITTLSRDGAKLTSLTEAVLFRENGTLCIDEFEGVAQKGNESLRELLNVAYKKGGKVKRMKKVKAKDGEDQVVEVFEVYRPIAIANIWGMEEVLSDRCIEMILEKSNKSIITKLIENFERNFQIISITSTISKGIGSVGSLGPIFENIQDGWNDYVTTSNSSNTSTHSNSSNTSNIYNKINNINIDGRDLELFLPLYLLAERCGVLDETLKISAEITKERKEKDIYQAKDVELYDFISQCSPSNDFVKVSRLNNDFRTFLGSEDKDRNPNTRWMGIALKRLKLIREKKRSNGMIVILDIKKAKEKIKMFK